MEEKCNKEEKYVDATFCDYYAYMGLMEKK